MFACWAASLIGVWTWIHDIVTRPIVNIEPVDSTNTRRFSDDKNKFYNECFKFSKFCSMNKISKIYSILYKI